jgi:hypothetical protein
VWSLWARMQCACLGKDAVYNLWDRIQCRVCEVGYNVEFVG